MKNHSKKKAAKRKGLLAAVPLPPSSPGVLASLGRLSTLQKVVAGLTLATLGLGYLTRRAGNSSNPKAARVKN